MKRCRIQVHIISLLSFHSMFLLTKVVQAGRPDGIKVSPGLLWMEFCLLSYLHADCLLWKLLELELFCSKEENSWHRTQLLHGSSYYANYPGSSHFIKALFSPFTYTKQEAKGAALICRRPWRQKKVPLFSQSIVLYGSTCSHKWKGKTDPFYCTVQPLL